MTIYTIGHSNITVDDFIRLLHQEGIEALLDVRSFPRRNLIGMDINKMGIDVLHIRSNGAIEADAFYVEVKKLANIEMRL